MERFSEDLELKKILLEDKVLVNNKVVREENHSLVIFDSVNLPVMKKNYILTLTEKGKFTAKEVSESEAKNKISRVYGKSILKKGRVQINFDDGRNIISNEKVKVGDSVLINLKDKKIEKILPIKEKSRVIIVKGKHLGKQGTIEKIDDKGIMVISDKKELNLNSEDLMVIN